MGDYKNAKIIGHMHFAHLAKEHPEIHVMSVSPGGVGGSFAETGHFPVKQLMAMTPCMFRCLCVTHACGPSASTVIGSKRYVDVLTGEPQWKPGSMPMSPQCCGCCCFWGARGAMVDNRPLAPTSETRLCVNRLPLRSASGCPSGKAKLRPKRP